MPRHPRDKYAANNCVTVRLNDSEKELLVDAAPYRKLSDFVRRAAIAAAKKLLVQRLNRDNR